MSKLPRQYQFIDFSDYGRPIAQWIARQFVNTKVTPIHLTILFILSGFLSILSILGQFYYMAAFFLILKSVLDAADGDLARLKKTPSHVGRYFDSNADIVLNFLFLLTFWYITSGSLVWMILAFVGVQLQGTLYHYYYVILRNKVGGDNTSRVLEDVTPKALKGETQQMVNILHRIYILLYWPYDKIIHFLDSDAKNAKPFPKWFMTIVSIYGLGFQLLIMAVMLVLHLEHLVIPFFVFYSVFILVLIGIRRTILK